MRILVVDDHAGMVRSTRYMLRGCEVEGAACGQEALDKLRAADFDAILCDITMPDMGGLALLDALGQWKPALARRVVFMSGAVVDAKARQRLQSLPNPCLDKPFTQAQLEQALAGAARAR